jgi:hypothetical protein
MMKSTSFPANVDAKDFLKSLMESATTKAVEEVLRKLPLADVHTYNYDPDAPETNWQVGCYHWLPVGRDRGNAGRIRLAGKPIYPPAERLINGMEALIEMMRLLELLKTPDAPPPRSPREAVLRYFNLPPLDQIPLSQQKINGKTLREHAREFARLLLLELKYDKKQKEFALSVRDHGVGQAPLRMHKTLLSLGSSDKGDKPYLIGVFGQGGSSTYAASRYSWILSRRAPDLLGDQEDGLGWTLVRHVIPKGRRDPYFAYLAAHPDGRVPSLPVAVADALGFKHGSQFCHVGYDFGSSASAITRNLYQALNHVLHNPVLPFDTDVAGTKATVYGNSYRLSNAGADRKDLDKNFGPQTIDAQ